MAEETHRRRYEEDLAAYLLDALEPDEAREFRVHLESCARCQNEERWLRAAVEQLPSSVEQLEPPLALRKRLMDRVQAEAAIDRKSARERQPRRRRWALGPRTIAALSAVALAAAGLGGYLIGKEADDPTTRTIQVEATPVEPSAQAHLVRRGNYGYLRVERLPVQRRGRIYQVWLQRGNRFEPSTLFVVRRNGKGTAAIWDDFESVDAVMVSEEPAAGSRRPTTKPLLIAKL